MDQVSGAFYHFAMNAILCFCYDNVAPFVPGNERTSFYDPGSVSSVLNPFTMYVIQCTQNIISAPLTTV